jgi:hypothetical protein
MKNEYVIGAALLLYFLFKKDKAKTITLTNNAVLNTVSNNNARTYKATIYSDKPIQVEGVQLSNVKFKVTKLVAYVPDDYIQMNTSNEVPEHFENRGLGAVSNSLPCVF